MFKNNPFRVLGVFGNTSERELLRQRNVISRYLEIGKQSSFDVDFPVLGSIERTTDSVQQALSIIEKDSNRFLQALLWFINSTKFDDIAFKHLAKGDSEKALEIWEKRISGKQFDLTAHLNAGNLLLFIANEKPIISKGEFSKGMDYVSRVLNSNRFYELSEILGLESTDYSEVVNSYLDTIYKGTKSRIDSPQGLTTIDFLEVVNYFPDEFAQPFNLKFIKNPVDAITSQIETTKDLRNISPEYAYDYGKNLYKETFPKLSLLEKILGKDNVQYGIVADKLGNEILQCSIEYFNFWQEDDYYDPGPKSLKLAKKAKGIVVGIQARQRLDNNLEVIQEWIDEAEERELNRSIDPALNKLHRLFEYYENREKNESNIKEFLSSSNAPFEEIKNELGSQAEATIQISSTIVGYTLGLLISWINKEQEDFKQFSSPGQLKVLATALSNALQIMVSLSHYSIDVETRRRLMENKKALISIATQVNQVVVSHSKEGKGWCYIATMVYGDYDHPQVMELRMFRDNILSKNIFGNKFIKVYYKYSPSLVRLLENQKGMNMAIKNALDLLIKYLPK